MQYTTRTYIGSFRGDPFSFARIFQSDHDREYRSSTPQKLVTLTYESLHEVADYIRYNGLTFSENSEALMPRCWAGHTDGSELSEAERDRLKALVPESFLSVSEREKLAIINLV